MKYFLILQERPYIFTSKNSQNLPPPVTDTTPTSSEPLVEVWVIVVLSILTFLLIIQTLALVVLSGSRKSQVSTVDFHSDEKSGHVNYVASEEKSSL